VTAYKLNVNGKILSVDVSPETPLLWVLRDTLELTGTKFGCGQAFCGACTVHIDGVAERSCSTRVSTVGESKILTIEGLSGDGSHPLQRAWLEAQVSQCGYCQAGMIMSCAALLAANRAPSDDDIDEALAGHICRCGTYPRIRKAIHAAAKITAELERDAGMGTSAAFTPRAGAATLPSSVQGGAPTDGNRPGAASVATTVASPKAGAASHAPTDGSLLQVEGGVL
jgi:aerobic-type carbon monoxide dehydrogenase small subunit (CoxS/CutS family)